MEGLIKKSLTLRGHKTSLALEEEFWAAINDIARRENRSARELVAAVDEMRNEDSSLASSIRIHVLRWYRQSESSCRNSLQEAKFAES